MRLCFPQRHLQRSIGATIFGAFVAMGLLTAALGAYGIYVLTAAGNFVVDLYDRPLMATNFERAAAVDFAQMDKELARRDRADEPGRAAIDARISRLSRVFSEDLAVAESRSLSDEERLAIDQIELLVAKWNELRLGNAQTASADELDRLAADIAHRFELLAEATTGQSFVARRKVVSAVTFFKYSSLAALVGALLLSGGLTLLLMRRIIRPLREAAAIADRIAEGELQAPIPPGGPDETGVLLRSMTVMQDSIRIMVEREKAQRRSAQTRLVDALESSHEAIVLMDAAGRIVIGNSQLARFFPTIASRLAPAMSFTDAFRSLEFSVGGAGAAAAFDPTEPAVGGLASRGREFWLADGRWLRVSRSATHDGGFFLLISDLLLSALVVPAIVYGLFHRFRGCLAHLHPAVNPVLRRDPQQLVEKALHLGLRQRALEQRDRLALHDREDRRDALDLKGLAQPRVGVEVDLGEHPRTAGSMREPLEDGTELLARTAPVGPEVDDDGDGHRGVDDHGLEVGFGHIAHDPRAGGRRACPVLAGGASGSSGGPRCQRGQVDGTVGVEGRLAHDSIIAAPVQRRETTCTSRRPTTTSASAARASHLPDLQPYGQCA